MYLAKKKDINNKKKEDHNECDLTKCDWQMNPDYI